MTLKIIYDTSVKCGNFGYIILTTQNHFCFVFFKYADNPVKRRNHAICHRAVFLSRRFHIRYAYDVDTRRMRRAYSCLAVLKYKAFLSRNTRPLHGFQIYIRRRLSVFDLISEKHIVKKAIYAVLGQDTDRTLTHTRRGEQNLYTFTFQKFKQLARPFFERHSLPDIFIVARDDPFQRFIRRIRQSVNLNKAPGIVLDCFSAVMRYIFRQRELMSVLSHKLRIDFICDRLTVDEQTVRIKYNRFFHNIPSRTLFPTDRQACRPHRKPPLCR